MILVGNKCDLSEQRCVSSNAAENVSNLLTQSLKRKKNFYHLYFFFQAEDGIRDAQESRGLGDVYKRQILKFLAFFILILIHL